MPGRTEFSADEEKQMRTSRGGGGGLDWSQLATTPVSQAAANVTAPSGIVQPSLPDVNISAKSDPYYGTGHEVSGEVSMPAMGGQLGVSGSITNDRYDPRFHNSVIAKFRKSF